MDKFTCTRLLDKMIKAAKRDYTDQKRPGNFAVATYGPKVAAAYPMTFKESHLRVAVSSVKKLNKGEQGSVIPCEAVRAFVTYLFHEEGQYDWPRVKKIAQEAGGDYAAATMALPRAITLDPDVVSFVSSKLQEDGGGSVSEAMVMIVTKVKEMEARLQVLAKDKQLDKANIGMLVETAEAERRRREALEGRYSEALNALVSTKDTLEAALATAPQDKRPLLLERVENLKQNIKYFEGL